MDVEYNMLNVIKTEVFYIYIYIYVVNGVNPESSNHKENTFFYFLYLFAVMDVHKNNCNSLMMYVCQIIICYILILYSPVCKLYLNKTGSK